MAFLQCVPRMAIIWRMQVERATPCRCRLGRASAPAAATPPALAQRLSRQGFAYGASCSRSAQRADRWRVGAVGDGRGGRGADFSGGIGLLDVAEAAAAAPDT